MSPVTSTTPSDSVSALVRLHVSGGIGTITLDSPRNRNALSRQLVTELGAALSACEDDPEVRVVVLRAEGRVFCSGADLSEAAGGSMAEGTRALVALQRLIVTLGVPVVVRVHGGVRAGGMGIVAAADVALAADEASFALTEVKLGLAPAVISLTVLPRLTSRAAQWTCLSGAIFGGAEAAEMGLVTASVPAADLDAEVERRCAELLTGAPQGLRETKQLLNRDLVTRIDGLADEVSAQSARLFASPAAREAMTAFLSRGR